jgi:hypothetical protein
VRRSIVTPRRSFPRRHPNSDRCPNSKTSVRETLACEVAVAASISGGAVVEIVLPAIDLDDKPVSQAGEIGDIAFTRRLAPEMKSACSP